MVAQVVGTAAPAYLAVAIGGQYLTCKTIGSGEAVLVNAVTRTKGTANGEHTVYAH